VKFFGVLAVFAGVLLAGAPALAQDFVRAPGKAEPHPEPIPAHGPAPVRREFELSILGAVGMGGNVDDSTVNRYGPGVGARGGITLKDPRVHLGGSFVRFFGTEDQTGKYYTNTFDLHLGYDLRFLDDHLLVRPEFAFGAAQAVSIQSDNAGYPLAAHLAPGVLLGLRLKPVLAFAQVRRDIVIGDWANSVSVLFGVGAIL